MDTYLDFEGCVAIFLVDFKIFGPDERDGFIGSFSTKDVPERDVLEADLLADVVVVSTGSRGQQYSSQLDYKS